MHLKGTSSAPAATSKVSEKSPDKLSREEQAKAEYEALKTAEATAIQHYQNISSTYYAIQTKLSNAARALEGIRTRKAKLEVYVKDLDNEITVGRWYQFHKWGNHDTLVYIKEVRRPKKYTWVTMVLIRAVEKWNGGKTVPTGNFEAAIVETNYPVIKDYLKEDTEQGRLGVLQRWGHSAEELLERAHTVWGDRKPVRLTSRDPECELRHKSLLRTIWFVKSEVQSPQ